MKILMLTGGLAGFLLGLVIGLAQSILWPAIFWRASVTSLALGLLLYWWGRVWFRSWRQARQQQSAALAVTPPEVKPVLPKKL